LKIANPVNSDPSGLETLCRQHTPALFPFLLNLTRNEADARDLLQDLFISLARHPERFHEIRDPRAFLFRSAHNLAMDHLRSRASRLRAHEAAGQARVALFAVPDNPDDAAYAEALSAALGELPPDQRAVVHLKLWEGMTLECIGRTLEISPNTAASRYRYGLEKLRLVLRPLYNQLQ
jgi:RNA polymerase sigma-70 factor (ECF subfamily)